jgi:hypothetical protein
MCVCVCVCVCLCVLLFIISLQHNERAKGISAKEKNDRLEKENLYMYTIMKDVKS